MPVIHPCRHCPSRPTCERRAALSKAMSSSPLKVTLARVSCPDYDALYAPGDRVSAKIRTTDEYLNYRGDVEIIGTITGPSAKKRGKWVVQVDSDSLHLTGFDDDTGEPEDPRPFVSVWPTALTKLDEPRRLLCKVCGNAMGANGEHLDPKGKGSCEALQAAIMKAADDVLV